MSSAAFGVYCFCSLRAHSRGVISSFFSFCFALLFVIFGTGGGSVDTLWAGVFLVFRRGSEPTDASDGSDTARPDRSMDKLPGDVILLASISVATLEATEDDLDRATRLPNEGIEDSNAVVALILMGARARVIEDFLCGLICRGPTSWLNFQSF